MYSGTPPGPFLHGFHKRNQVKEERKVLVRDPLRSGFQRVTKVVTERGFSTHRAQAPDSRCCARAKRIHSLTGANAFLQLSVG